MTTYSKYFEKIRIRQERDAHVKEQAPRCQWDGCDKPGPHRAPVGRMKEGEYFHFCVDHVREYNKGYNYFSGLSNSEIARYQKEALTGHRPTWSVGSNGKPTASAAADFSPYRSGRAGAYRRQHDPLNLFSGARRPTRPAPQRKVKPLEAKALETLGLSGGATGAEIRARYTSLVKRHHPDTNGGDRTSEDRFRDVLQAYRLLKQAGLC